LPPRRISNAAPAITARPSNADWGPSWNNPVSSNATRIAAMMTTAAEVLECPRPASASTAEAVSPSAGISSQATR
jgi:hypothetical protein